MPKLTDYFKKVIKDEIREPLEIPITRSIGGVIWVSFYGSLIKIGDETFLQFLGQDITDRKRAEQDLKKFYFIHAATRKRQGFPIQPYRFFKNMWKILYPQGYFTLLLAELNQTKIAGIVLFKPLVEQSEEEWTNVINTNLIGTFYCCKEVGKHMIKRKVGKVINMSSIRGFIGGPNETSYCASKGAIIQLTKALALEWAKFNINVNAVAPGFMKTEILKDMPEKIINYMKEKVYLKRMGEPEDIAKAFRR